MRLFHRLIFPLPLRMPCFFLGLEEQDALAVIKPTGGLGRKQRKDDSPWRYPLLRNALPI